jgi:hypothetical protein
MKVCPKCGRVYTDETQAFCLMDGSPLADGASQPTVTIPEAAQTVTMAPVKKKSRGGVWIAVIAIVLIVGGGIVAALLFAAYRMGQTANVKVNVAGSPTPRSTGSPRSTPATTATGPGATGETPATSTDETSTSGEETPITWSTSAATFKTDPGLVYTFDCPADGTAGTVWGSDVYTTDSSICTAGVHAGKITLEKGGRVTIEITGGRTTYGATTRNGITSVNYGQYPHSFVFRDAGSK